MNLKTRKHIYHFSILIEKDEDGFYVATVPSLKGCHTQAKDLSTLYKRIREAIELCLEVERNPTLNQFIGIHQMEIAV